jgi:polygalacturonase
MVNGTTLSESVTDYSAVNFRFDGIVFRPQINTQAPATNQFTEATIELQSSPIAPVILSQPQTQTRSAGQTATFTVGHNGSLPLSYQWIYSTNTPIADATNATFTIPDVQPADEGAYSVIISNPYGVVTSAVAQLSVYAAPPSIQAQPQSLTAIPGQNATFSVNAIGSDPLSYQWFYNTNTPLPDAAEPVVTLINVQPSDAGSYSVLVSNLLGTVVSSNAVLTVNTNPAAPVFITQPVPVAAWPGDTVNFSAAAVGTQPITYQWKKNSASIDGATSTTLTLTNVQPSDAGTYTVTAANGIGSTTSTAALLSVAIRATPPLPVIPTNQFNILDYGASGDGLTDNAGAIQSAINGANAARGGSVIVPASGSAYLSGPISLASGVNLQINGGAMLQMLPRASWPGTTTFINGLGLHDVAITGSGVIDGQGTNWWFPKAISRPNFINFSGCTRVLVEGVTLQNPPTFHLMLKGGNNGLTVQSITINTPGDSPNTDGMDIGSTNVLIRNCIINAGDDNIQIGSSGATAADITVSNCTFGTGHGVSLGSPTGAGVHDLLVHNCTFNGTDYGIRMKSDNDRGGLVENLRYLDITMTSVRYPLVIYGYYNTFGTPNVITPQIAAAQPAALVTSLTPIWRNITISNLTATALTGANIAGIIWGRPEMLVSNVTLYGVNIEAPTKTFEIYNARAIRITDSNLATPSSTNSLTLYNAEVTLTNSAPSTNLVTLGGMALPPTNNVLALFNAQAAVTDTNMLGSGTLTLGASALTLTQPSVNLSNTLSVVTASTLALAGTSNSLNGALTGAGMLTLDLPSASLLTLQGSLSKFSGTIALANDGTLRINQGGGTTAAFDAGPSGTIDNHSASTGTVALGALSGGAGSVLRGSDQAGPGVDTYVIGGRNSDTSFAGTIADGTDHTVALTKTGTGSFALNGANTYSGGTVVSNGALLVNGTVGIGPVTVANNAVLGGSGVMAGAVTLNGTLSPGTSVGTITISNDLVLTSTALLQYELGTNSDHTVVIGHLTLGGTLNISDAGGFGPGVYLLASYGGGLTDNGLGVGAAPTGYAYAIDTSTLGQVRLSVALPPSTIDIGAGNLQDASGNLAPTDSVAVLVVDTGTNGFADARADFALSTGATWGTDDKVIGLWDLRDSVSCSGNDGGALCAETVMSYLDGIAPGQPLQLYWFPSLTLSSNVLGNTQYGRYTDQVGIDGSDPWRTPPGESALTLWFITAAFGGANPETAGRATLMTVAPMSEFESWQMQYFGCTNCANAAAGEDFDGDGLNNEAEFLTGTDPTNSASAFRIISVVREGDGLRLTWTTGNGKTNALERSATTLSGSYSNNFVTIFTASNIVGTVTNYFDAGAATNMPSQYYRIRLVP